jgi:hypothetical protein
MEESNSITIHYYEENSTYAQVTFSAVLHDTNVHVLDKFWPVWLNGVHIAELALLCENKN